MALLAAKATAIAEAVADGDFSCEKKHGNCLECGEPYGHEHVCAGGRRPTTIKLSSKTKRGGDGPLYEQLAFDLLST